MRLYLVQHGNAATKEQDPERPLTDRGTAAVQAVASAAGQAGLVTAGRILHSGLLRAAQTARIWADTLGIPVEAADALTPMDDPHTWAEQLPGVDTGLMLVGHLPHLQRLAALLLCGDPDNAVVAFHNGGLVAFEHDGEHWSLQLALPPQVVTATSD